MHKSGNKVTLAPPCRGEDVRAAADVDDTD